MTKQRSLLLFTGALGIFFLSPLLAANKATATVVINELYPKTSDVTWEWVELYNTGSESISLHLWKLDHTASDATSYILNASMNIQPHGFLTLYGNQTAIVFSIEGDTVRLFDLNNKLVDSQSYPGILGYNTSMGRSSDGAGSWAICTTATFNATNDCPAPSPTPTSTPYPTATPTPIPLPKNTPTPTQAQQTFGSLLPSPMGTQVLGAMAGLSPTPRPKADRPLAETADVLQFAVSKTRIAYILLGIAAAALSLMLALWFKRQQFRRKL